MGRQDTASDDVARGRPDPPPDAVRAQLSRVVGSPAFEHAPVLRRFLVHVVEGVIEGRADQLKEYALGVDVFDRGDAFDPHCGSRAIRAVTRGEWRHITGDR